MKTLLVLLALIMVGCASTPNAEVGLPAGCEQALVYKIPGFMPNGPMITRVSVSTALAVANTAGHPEVKLLTSVAMPILYRAVLTNNLASAVADIQDKFKAPAMVNYITPLLTLFDALNQGGVIKGNLTDCDKNVLASLFRNIGLDSGSDPTLFE